MQLPAAYPCSYCMHLAKVTYSQIGYILSSMHTRQEASADWHDLHTGMGSRMQAAVKSGASSAVLPLSTLAGALALLRLLS